MLGLGSAFWATGGYSKTRWLIAGEALQADSHYLDFGTLSNGEFAFRDVTLTNVSGDSMRIVGGTIDCRCRVTEVPQSIASGSNSTVRINVRAPLSTSGRVSFPVELWTDSTRQPKIWLTVDFLIQ